MRLPPIVSALLVSATLHAQDKPGRLTIDKLLDFESVGSPRISPDSRTILYTRSWIDKVNDRRRSALWIMDLDGKNQRFLVKGSSPRWSPLA